MKKIVSTVILAIVIFSSVWADYEEDPMLGFILGSYRIVGQEPEDGDLYKGTMSISMDEDGNLEVIREINGETVECSAEMDSVFEGEVSIFVVTFTVDGDDYKAVYLIHSDLDNYARLTGFIFEEERETEVPGIEALFPDMF